MTVHSPRGVITYIPLDTPYPARLAVLNQERLGVFRAGSLSMPHGQFGEIVTDDIFMLVIHLFSLICSIRQRLRE